MPDTEQFSSLSEGCLYGVAQINGVTYALKIDLTGLDREAAIKSMAVLHRSAMATVLTYLFPEIIK